MSKLVITCAVTGSLSQKGDGKGQSPYLPVTPDEIAEDSKRACDAGASVLHLHARDPKTGAPTADLDIFAEVVEKTRALCPKAIINCTTGGGMGMTDEERIAIVPRVKPDMASFNMGSMTYGMYNPAAKKWVLDYPWANSFASMTYFGNVMKENKAKPELEISADEVEASHGATVGQLDEAAVFYMRSRGLTDNEARRMLTTAFCHAVTDRLEDRTLAASISEMIDTAMPGGMPEAQES